MTALDEAVEFGQMMQRVKNSRQISNELRKMLRLADIERRIREAEATIAELRPAFEKARAEAKKLHSAPD